MPLPSTPRLPGFVRISPFKTTGAGGRLRSHSIPRLARRLLAGSLAVILASSPAIALSSDEPDRIVAMDAPPSASGVQAAIAAPYLTPDEAADKRIFFGRWTRDDLTSPARAARVALIRCVYDDPALLSPDADTLDRAEGALMRGDLLLAIELTPDPKTLRAVRIRAAALEAQGKPRDAVALARPILERVLKNALDQPADVVDAVRIVTQLIRLDGPAKDDKGKPVGAAADFHAMMGPLADVRTRLDRLYWPANLAEAELLYAKDNKPKAQEALVEVLSMNPSCAQAWAMLGRISVDAFSFDKAEQIAARLNLIASPDFDPENPDDNPPGVSALASGIIARAMLRQIDGQLALDALAPALAAQPNNPELLALQCAAEALRFDFPALKTRLESFDKQFPNSPLAQFAVGRALAEARQYDLAGPYLDAAHQRAPNWPDPLIERGLLDVQAARDEQALEALEKAFALDPFNARADNSLRLVREMRTYDRIETPHFTIRFKATPAGTPAPDALLASEMPEVLEENHRIVTGSQPGGIDHALPAGTKTFIDLMPNHEWFGVRIAGMPQIHTIAASTGPLIAMESPREGPGHLGPYDWARVLRHEYVHTVTLSRSNNRIPHWFTEAAAVYLELGPRDYPTNQMLARAVDTDTLFDFSYINVAFVRPKKPNDRSFAYAQGEWMYSYMIETFGHRAPLELMDKYAQGLREEAAFEAVLKVSREKFFEGFKVWARAQAESWGLVRTKGMPSVRELIEGELPIVNKNQNEAGSEPPDLPPPTREQVDRWLVKHPTHPDLLELSMDLQITAAGGKVTSDIVPAVERYAAARPVDPKPHRLLAKMYLDQAAAEPGALSDQAAKAIPHLEFLDAREQKTPAYAIELAKRYAALSQFDKAQAAAIRATQLAPFAAGVREVAATIAIQAKNFDLAQRQLEALAQIEPTRDIHAKRLEALKRLREQK